MPTRETRCCLKKDKVKKVIQMTQSAIIAFAAAFVLAITGLGTALGQGKAAASAMEAIARQPDAAGNIRSTLIIAMALLEALTIYALLIAFMLIAKI